MTGSRRVVSTLLLVVLVLCLIHRPLPEGLTKKSSDRLLIHFFEASLRVTYYWPVRVFSPRENATDGAVFFIHGGGFALGNIDIYDSLTRRIAKMLNSVVVSVEYRLSPETVFPGALLDCEAALEYFIEIAEQKYGVSPEKIILMGDSAGGNLVAAITHRRRDGAKQPRILGQVLLYPLLQLADLQSMSYRYHRKYMAGTSLVDPESVAYYYMFYAGIDMDRHGDLVKYALVNGHIAPHLREKVDRILAYDSFSYMNYRNETLMEREPVVYSEEAQRLMAPYITNPAFSPLMQESNAATTAESQVRRMELSTIGQELARLTSWTSGNINIKEDLSNLPQAFVMTCEYDVLRDEGIMYAKRLKDAGVKTEARNYENGFHAMLNFHHEIQEAGDSLNDIVAWTRAAFDSLKMK